MTELPRAVISECGQYRYLLRRTWDPDLPRCGWLMLNPSTADAEQDDATVRRCVGWAKKWGFGGITIANLFAYRSTYPKDLLGVVDPVGPENELFVAVAAVECTRILLAWGTGGPARRLVQPVATRYVDLILKRCAELWVLGTTDDGCPLHPLARRKMAPGAWTGWEATL